MKKSMINMLLWIIAIIFCINGCVMDSFKEDIGIGKDNKTEKAYLSLSLNESRTVLPQALDQTKLTYKLVGRYNEEDHQLGEWTYSDMLAAHTELMLGQWDFTLTANDGTQDVLVGNITNYSIVAGDNQLSFTMKECSTGTGIISVTARMPHGKVAKVEAILRDASDDTLIDSQTLSVNDCTDDPAQDYALYEINSANKGLYTLLLSLYQSASDTECINEQIMLVRVEPGCLSAGTVVFEQVNTYWHIVYHFENFDVTDDPVLVTKYNKDMQIILPSSYRKNNKDNYYSIENYNNEDRTGDKINLIDYDNSGDIELWVKSKYGFPVKLTDLSALLDTLNTSGGPYTIVLTDNTPDMSAVKSALTGHNAVKVNLNMADCTGLTSIGNNAFYNCKGLTSVTMPDSVTSIGTCAFYNCSGLTSIEIPDSVTSIGGSAFYNCNKLTSVTIPNNVTSINDGAFMNSGLTSIEIPNSVTSIGKSAFEQCYSLRDITIPNSVTNIAISAFIGCRNLTHIVVDESNTVYDSRNNCNAIIETATNTLIVGCKNTVIPNTVTSIGSKAFSDCGGLTSVTIPDSVISISERAFYNCRGLKRVNYTGTIAGWCGIKFINGDSNPLLYAHNLYIDGELVTSVTIPDSVTSISDFAFYSCSELTSVTIGSGVTRIGFMAFYNCSGLKSVTISDSVTSIGNKAFSGCSGLTTLNVKATTPPSFGSSMLYNCSALTTIYVPIDSVDTYKAADGWKSFATKIEGKEF